VSIAKTVVGPSSAFTINGWAVYSTSNSESYSYLGTNYGGPLGGGGGSGSCTVNCTPISTAAVAFDYWLVIIPVIVIVVIVVLVLVLVMRKKPPTQPGMMGPPGQPMGQPGQPSREPRAGVPPRPFPFFPESPGASAREGPLQPRPAGLVETGRPRTRAYLPGTNQTSVTEYFGFGSNRASTGMPT
jgi:hypothetical protein